MLDTVGHRKLVVEGFGKGAEGHPLMQNPDAHGSEFLPMGCNVWSAGRSYGWSNSSSRRRLRASGVRSWKRLGQIIGIKVWFLSTRTLFVFLDLWNLGENSVPILQFQLKQINGARSVLLFLRFARYSLNLDEQNGWIDVTFAGSKRNRLNSRIEEVPDLNMSCLRYGSCRAGMKRLQYSVSVLLVFFANSTMLVILISGAKHVCQSRSISFCVFC